MMKQPITPVRVLRSRDIIWSQTESLPSSTLRQGQLVGWKMSLISLWLGNIDKSEITTNLMC